MVVMDIGAYVGDFAEIVIEESGRNEVDTGLHLFEPMEKTFDQLKKKPWGPGVRLNMLGASNKTGKQEIHFDREASTLASLYRRDLGDYSMELNQSATVKLKRMDEYIEENDISHIHFVKIDVEGHEVEVMEGFGKYLDGDFIDYIQFEYGETFMDSRSFLRDAFRLLEKNNFSVAKLFPNGLEVRKYRRYMENFSYSNYVGISNSRLNS